MNWEGTQPVQAAQADQRDILYPFVIPSSLSARKAGVKKEEAEDIHSAGICLPRKLFCMMSPAFLEVAEHLPAYGM